MVDDRHWKREDHVTASGAIAEFAPALYDGGKFDTGSGFVQWRAGAMDPPLPPPDLRRWGRHLEILRPPTHHAPVWEGVSPPLLPKMSPLSSCRPQSITKGRHRMRSAKKSIHSKFACDGPHPLPFVGRRLPEAKGLRHRPTEPVRVVVGSESFGGAGTSGVARAFCLPVRQTQEFSDASRQLARLQSMAAFGMCIAGRATDPSIWGARQLEVGGVHLASWDDDRTPGRACVALSSPVKSFFRRETIFLTVSSG